MTTTVHRPAPLPPRPGQPAAAPVRLPLPAGAAAWSRTYIDGKGVPQRSDYPVPVDADGRRTEHVRYACRGHIEVDGMKQPCDHVAWMMPGDPVRFCPDHGCQLTLDGQAKREPILPLAAVGKAVEPSARPWWVLLAELAAGIGEHAGHVPWLVPLASTPALAGAAYAGTRSYLTRRALRNNRIEEGQSGGRRVETIRRRARAALYAGAGAGGWLTLAAAVNPASKPGALVLGGSLAALFAATAPTWWRYLEADRNRPQPDPVIEPHLPTAAAAAAVEQAALRDADAWTTEVAISGGLPNTVVDLTTWKADPGGRRMVIRAQRGALTDEKIRTAVPLIAAAFDVARSAIGWIEEYEGSPRAALLLVQPNSPLNERIDGELPDVVPAGKAVADMGKRIDGGRLTTRLFTPGWGAPSRLIIGTKGSGKTELLRRLLLVMLKVRIEAENGPRRLVAPFLHDPKRGADYGAFRRLVCGFSIDSDTLHMIVEAFGREMDRRYDALACATWIDSKGREREGERPFDPSTMGPILSLVADEFHIDAKDQALMAKLDPFARKMRAAGIEINVATHLSTIGDTGSQGFRDMLAGGEAWLLRTTLGLNAALATGGTLTGDPRLLPRVPGMVLHASGEETTMQARVAYMDSEELYDALYDELNRPLIQPIDWPQETLDAFGPEFVEWMRACQERPIGSPVVSAPKPFAGASGPSSASAAGAVDALRRILLDAGKPLSRSEIAAHPLWRAGGWSATTTLGAALTTLSKAGETQGPHGQHELTAAARERLRAESDEAGE